MLACAAAGQRQARGLLPQPSQLLRLPWVETFLVDRVDSFAGLLAVAGLQVQRRQPEPKTGVARRQRHHPGLRLQRLGQLSCDFVGHRQRVDDLGDVRRRLCGLQRRLERGRVALLHQHEGQVVQQCRVVRVAFQRPAEAGFRHRPVASRQRLFGQMNPESPVVRARRQPALFQLGCLGRQAGARKRPVRLHRDGGGVALAQRDLQRRCRRRPVPLRGLGFAFELPAQRRRRLALLHLAGDFQRPLGLLRTYGNLDGATQDGWRVRVERDRLCGPLQRRRTASRLGMGTGEQDRGVGGTRQQLHEPLRRRQRLLDVAAVELGRGGQGQQRRIVGHRGQRGAGAGQGPGPVANPPVQPDRRSPHRGILRIGLHGFADPLGGLFVAAGLAQCELGQREHGRAGPRVALEQSLVALACVAQAPVGRVEPRQAVGCGHEFGVASQCRLVGRSRTGLVAARLEDTPAQLVGQRQPGPLAGQGLHRTQRLVELLAGHPLGDQLEVAVDRCGVGLGGGLQLAQTRIDPAAGDQRLRHGDAVARIVRTQLQGAGESLVGEAEVAGQRVGLAGMAPDAGIVDAQPQQRIERLQGRLGPRAAHQKAGQFAPRLDRLGGQSHRAAQHRFGLDQRTQPQLGHARQVQHLRAGRGTTQQPLCGLADAGVFAAGVEHQRLVEVRQAIARQRLAHRRRLRRGGGQIVEVEQQHDQIGVRLHQPRLQLDRLAVGGHGIGAAVGALRQRVGTQQPGLGVVGGLFDELPGGRADGVEIAPCGGKPGAQHTGFDVPRHPGLHLVEQGLGGGEIALIPPGAGDGQAQRNMGGGVLQRGAGVPRKQGRKVALGFQQQGVGNRPGVARGAELARPAQLVFGVVEAAVDGQHARQQQAGSGRLLVGRDRVANLDQRRCDVAALQALLRRRQQDLGVAASASGKRRRADQQDRQQRTQCAVRPWHGRGVRTGWPSAQAATAGHAQAGEGQADQRQRGGLGDAIRIAVGAAGLAQAAEDGDVRDRSLLRVDPEARQHDVVQAVPQRGDVVAVPRRIGIAVLHDQPAGVGGRAGDVGARGAAGVADGHAGAVGVERRRAVRRVEGAALGVRLGIDLVRQCQRAGVAALVGGAVGDVEGARTGQEIRVLAALVLRPAGGRRLACAVIVRRARPNDVERRRAGRTAQHGSAGRQGEPVETHLSDPLANATFVTCSA
jgi:hypothetical protein